MSQPKTSRTGNGIPERQELETELIRRICSGEKELYYELIRPYERSVYLAAFSILRNEADAEEAAQDTFLKAFRALSTFRGEARFSTWLERIALNEARMRYRHSKVAACEPLEEQDAETGEYVPILLGDWREIPSEALEKKEIRQILSQALLALPETYRQIVLLRDVQQLSIAETAEALGITVPLVKIRLFRARLKLRDLITPLQNHSQVTSRNLFRKGAKPW